MSGLRWGTLSPGASVARLNWVKCWQLPGPALLEPWGMFTVGTVIFITVLGFNLMGEGLRRRLAYERDTEQTIYGYILSKVLPQLRKKYIQPISHWTRARPVMTVGAVLICITAVALLIRWRVQATGEQNIELPMPDHIWASEWHDPYGSMQTDAIGPQSPNMLWSFESRGRIKGGIAVSKEGQIYFGDDTGTVYAIDREGNLQWEYSVSQSIIGSPCSWCCRYNLHI